MATRRTHKAVKKIVKDAVKKKPARAAQGGLATDAAAAAPIALFDQSDEATREGIRLGFLIHDVSRMRRAAYDQFMKPLGITRAQWWVLAHLSRHDGMVQTQLADILEVGKASLGDVIEGLESAGWVERRPDPTDKRAKRVYLTRPAQSLIKRMTVMENQFNDQILGPLTASERRELNRSLLKIKGAISKLNLDAGASTAAD